MAATKILLPLSAAVLLGGCMSSQSALLATLSYPPCAEMLLGGCVSAQATLLSSESYPPVPETDVQVFLAREYVPTTCERIAVIHTRGDVDLTSENQMLAAARRRAGKIGANAILIGYMRDPSAASQASSLVFGTLADRKGRMDAFRCSRNDEDPSAASRQ